MRRKKQWMALLLAAVVAGTMTPAEAFAAGLPTDYVQEGNATEDTEGTTEGTTEGSTEGTTEGTTEGSTEGTTEGSTEGTTEGSTEGTTEGSTEGSTEGITEGSTEGTTEGTTEGSTEGTTEGEPAVASETDGQSDDTSAQSEDSTYEQLKSDATIVKDFNFKSGLTYSAGTDLSSKVTFYDKNGNVISKPSSLSVTNDEYVIVKIPQAFQYQDGKIYDVYIKVIPEQNISRCSWTIKVSGSGSNTCLTISPAALSTYSFQYEIWLQTQTSDSDVPDISNAETSVHLVAGSCWTSTTEGAKPYGNDGKIYSNVDNGLQWVSSSNNLMEYWMVKDSSDNKVSKYILGHGMSSLNTVKGGYVHNNGASSEQAETVLGYLCATVSVTDTDGNKTSTDEQLIDEKIKESLIPSITVPDDKVLYWNADTAITVDGVTYPAGSDIPADVLKDVVITENVAFTAVLKDKPTVDAAVTANDVTYNGQDQKLVTVTPAEGSTDKVAVYYSTDKEVWTDEVPTGKKAGDYTIYYKVVSTDDAYVPANSEVQEVTVTVKKLDVTAEVEAADKYWDGTTTATLTKVEVPADQVMAGDSIYIENVTADFENADVGTGKNVFVHSDDANIIGSGYSNYNITIPETTTASISKAAKNSPANNQHAVIPSDETIDGKNDGKLTNVTDEMEYRPVGSEEWISIAGDTVEGLPDGEYEVRYKETDATSASDADTVVIGQGRMLNVSVSPETEKQVGYTFSTDKSQVSYNGEVTTTLKINKGYSKTDDFQIWYEDEFGDEVDITDQFVEQADGSLVYTETVPVDRVYNIQGIADITAPTGSITVDGNSWTEFLNMITFGNYFKDTQDVTITAEDEGSGVNTISYYVANDAMSEEDVRNLDAGKWTEGTTFSVSPDNVSTSVIYAKLTDNAGNVRFISSDGLVFDGDAPTIVGIENGKEYCKEASFDVGDNNLAAVYIDGEKAVGENDHYTIAGDDKSHTIKVTDKAGNETEYTITVYADHLYDDDNWTQVGEPKTDEDGKTYVTEQNTCEHCGKVISRTRLQQNDKEFDDITEEETSYGTTVKVERETEGINNPVIGGLSTDSTKNLLTEDDKQVGVTLTLKVKTVEKTEISDDAVNAMADVAAKTEDEKSELKEGMYLNLSMYKQVTGQNEEKVENATTSSPVTVRFDLPENLKAATASARNYYVIQNFNGETKVLEAECDGTTISFQTSECGDVSIWYTEEDVDATVTENNVTYNGQDQELVTVTTASGDEGKVKVQFSTDGGTTWTDNVPTGKNAGDYTFQYKVVGTDPAYVPVDSEVHEMTVKVQQKMVYAEVEAADKQWDGTTDATISKEAVSAQYIEAGDTLEITGITGQFRDSEVGDGKPVDLDSTNMKVTGNGSENYYVIAPLKTSASIDKADRLSPSEDGHTVGTEAETVDGKNDGKLTNVTDEMEYRPVGSDEWIPITGDTVENLPDGDYEVRYKENEHYNASKPDTVTVNQGRKLTITVTPDPFSQVGYSFTVDKNTASYNEDLTGIYKLNEGYSELENFAVILNGETLDFDEVFELQEDGSYVLKKNVLEDQDYVIQGIDDITAPTGSITIEDNSWTEFLNNITFGLFFNETKDVTIAAEDKGSGVDTISYYVSDKELTEEEVNNLDADKWTVGDTLSVSPEFKGVIYAKLTDKRGNTSYISSNGLVFDATAPSIIGIEDGKEYCRQASFDAKDDNIDAVYIDGEDVTSESGHYTIAGDDKTHTIKVVDQAGNATEYTISVFADHLFEEENWTQVGEPVEEDGKTYITEQNACAHCGKTIERKRVLVAEFDDVYTETNADGGVLNTMWKTDGLDNGVVGGLDTDSIRDLLSDNDEENLKDAGIVSLNLYIAKKDEAEIAADTVSAMETVAASVEDPKSELNKGIYVNMTMEKQTYTKESGTVTETLENATTSTPVTVRFDLPEELQAAEGVRNYYVIQTFNGETSVIEAQCDGTTISFQTDKCGDYSIWYTEEKVDATVDANDVTYNGQDQELVTATPAEGDEGKVYVEYSTDGGETWTTDVPTGKNAGLYTVKYRVKGESPEYVPVDPSEKEVMVYIAPKTVDVNVTVADKAWDGTTDADITEITVPADQIEEGDSINISGVKASFEDSEVGEDKVVNLDYTDMNYDGIGSSNYELNVQPITYADIVKAEMPSPAENDHAVTTEDETIDKKNDGKLTNVTDEMEYRPVGSDEWISIDADTVENLEPGDYEVRYKENEHYNASEADVVTVNPGRMLQITVTPESEDQVGYSFTVDKNEVSYEGELNVTYKLNEGYSQTDEFAITMNGVPLDFDSVFTKQEDGSYTLNFAVTEDEDFVITGIADITAPTGSASIGDKKWTEFKENVSYDTVYNNESQTITFTAEDKGSGVDTISYYVSNKALTLDELKALADSDWTVGNSVTLDPGFKGVVYAKLTDKAGNVSYISTDGIEIKKAAAANNNSQNISSTNTGDTQNPAFWGTLTGLSAALVAAIAFLLKKLRGDK